MNKKFNNPILCYDIVFKTIFSKNPNILAKLISSITELPYPLLKDNIILETNELPIDKSKEKAKRCDFIARIDKNTIINVELNRQSHSGLIIKNLSYVCKLFSLSFDKGNEYNKNIQLMQININCFNEPNIQPLTKYYLKEETSNLIYTKNLVIFSLNIVNCHKLYYNKTHKKHPNYITWGTLINSNNLNEINKISKQLLNIEERNNFMKNLNELTTNDLFRTEEEMIRLAEWEQKMILEDAREEGLTKGFKQGIEQGIEKGIEKGIEQNTIKTIISLLKKNISLEDISEITGKTIEEIKEIKKNN